MPKKQKNRHATFTKTSLDNVKKALKDDIKCSFIQSQFSRNFNSLISVNF